MSHDVKATDATNDGSQDVATMPERRSPCQNGDCRKAPTAPAVPPAPVEIGTRDLRLAVASRLSSDLLASTSCGFLSWESSAEVQPGFPTTIDRPPRG
jgi:hypothetical protein